MCFAYLDAATLLQCELVSKEWHVAAQGPSLWTAQYCATWRGGAPLPAPLARAFSRDQLTRICRERKTVPLELSTRASWWVHQELTAHVLNVVLEYRRSYVAAIRTMSALRPLGISCLPTATTPGDDNEGVCYFEVTIRGRGSVGVAQYEKPTPSQDEVRSSSYVGRLQGSYGYQGFDGNLYWGDGASLGHQSFAEYGPSWGYRRGSESPTTDQRSTTIGCGLHVGTRQLFFTKNGEFLGYAPVRVETSNRGYSAAVALENRADTAEINLGRAPFVFDIEAYVAERPSATPSL